MTSAQRLWVLECTGEALKAKHVWPRMAACEAALESGYGTSALARLGFNYFGMKQHTHPIYKTLNLPTKEYINSEWMQVIAAWVEYENPAECFADRIATLVRLRGVYPHYQAALIAPTAEIYIAEVSKTWSTDPARASKCLAIYNQISVQPADLSAQGDV